MRCAAARMTSDECGSGDLTFAAKRASFRVMKRALPLALVLPFALLLGACSNQTGPAVTHQAPGVFGNAASYDAYVERRANDLVRAGVKSSAANHQAEIEAKRRYGPRTDVDRTGGTQSRTLKTSEIDAALAKARN